MSEYDPCVWPDSGVLMNRLGLRTQGELVEAEYALTLQRRLELRSKPIAGQFDLEHLCAIHRYLFQDLFDWAGQVRRVPQNCRRCGRPLDSDASITSGFHDTCWRERYE